LFECRGLAGTLELSLAEFSLGFLVSLVAGEANLQSGRARSLVREDGLPALVDFGKDGERFGSLGKAELLAKLGKP